MLLDDANTRIDDLEKDLTGQKMLVRKLILERDNAISRTDTLETACDLNEKTNKKLRSEICLEKKWFSNDFLSKTIFFPKNQNFEGRFRETRISTLWEPPKSIPRA